ncbi:hypothetical protein A2824_03395 [Candidatus Nomurabacteria bacterium RIFCSPHIGHO2_01_FULL_42_16]|uniref:Uncharacterized protein n=1 Tax=Candidatus Nomurabacteria bacterium RIFCSPHIGHO2_01_FULL_42_16 TaxID=1801743 RepID=A0A1F6VIN3_9BACT|nr:MAG: hypothetical protein A2824_03395 [Candidatus Nomurabacteria bacterium RIFCSPHIGHO2_01_FULL_42_16]
MGLKKFFLKKMIKFKLKGQNIPKEQQDMILNAMLKKPELFKKIGAEIKQKKKEGKSEALAAMEVMRKYQNDIRRAM